MNKKLKGIEVATSAPVRIKLFAGDAFVVIRLGADTSSFEAVLCMYQEASNFHVNISKTFTLTTGFPLFPPPNSMNLKYHTNPFRHLGIQFNGKGILIKQTKETFSDKLIKRLAVWVSRKLPLAGCVVLTNTFLLSKV